MNGVGAAPALPLWRKALPFVLGGGLIAFVVGRVDFDAFSAALERTNYAAFLLFVATFNVLLLAADSLATTYIYRQTVCPVRFREFFVIRGASYLPSILNHHIGQGWLTYFVAKVYQASIWRVAGATLLVYATTFGCLLLMGVLALPFSGGRTPWLLPVVGVIAAAGVAYLAVIRVGPAFLRRNQTASTLIEVGVKGHLLALGARVPHMVVLFCGSWWVFSFFDVDIPLGDALALMPPIMFVAALPLTPQGVGTRDALALELLASYAPGSPEEQAGTIAAATLTWAVAITLVQLCLAPVFLGRAMRLLGEPGDLRSDAAP